MSQLAYATLAVLGVIYLVPFVLYGVVSRFAEMPSPQDVGPARFLSAILLSKLGTAVAFVAVLSVARDVWADRWPLYALLWFVMFAATEVGDLVSGRSTPAEAVVGIVSEAVYTPVAAWLAVLILT